MIAQASGGVEGALLGPVGFVVAFFVGTISFFSPCVLPLLPGYLSFVSGLTGEEVDQGKGRAKVLLGIGLFILGFAIMFTALGAVASAVGGALVRNLSAVNRIAGGVVIVLGLSFMVPRLFPFFERERRPFFSRVKPGVAGALPLGLAFAAGWTPCVGPGLGVMLSLGFAEGSVGRASLLLFFFSLGFGVWFLLAGLGLRKAMGASGWLRRNARALQIAGGGFMLVIGLLLVTDQWANVMAPLTRLVNRFAPPI